MVRPVDVVVVDVALEVSLEAGEADVRVARRRVSLRRLPLDARAAARARAERHVEASRTGELVGMDCFFVWRRSGTNGSVWQLTAIDVAFTYAWVELATCPRGDPTGAQTSKLARRVCS